MIRLGDELVHRSSASVMSILNTDQQLYSCNTWLKSPGLSNFRCLRLNANIALRSQSISSWPEQGITPGLFCTRVDARNTWLGMVSCNATQPAEYDRRRMLLLEDPTKWDGFCPLGVSEQDAAGHAYRVPQKASLMFCGVTMLDTQFVDMACVIILA